MIAFIIPVSVEIRQKGWTDCTLNKALIEVKTKTRIGISLNNKISKIKSKYSEIKKITGELIYLLLIVVIIIVALILLVMIS